MHLYKNLFKKKNINDFLKFSNFHSFLYCNQYANELTMMNQFVMK